MTIWPIQLLAALKTSDHTDHDGDGKNRDIAGLMSMGAKRRQIRKIFVPQGVLIGAAGTGIGLVPGYTLSSLPGRYHWLTLN